MAAYPNDLLADIGPSDLTGSSRARRQVGLAARPPAVTPRLRTAIESATVSHLLIVGLPILVLLMILTAIDAGGQVVLWETPTGPSPDCWPPRSPPALRIAVAGSSAGFAPSSRWALLPGSSVS